jgi:hypothetical protein
MQIAFDYFESSFLTTTGSKALGRVFKGEADIVAYAFAIHLEILVVFPPLLLYHS